MLRRALLAVALLTPAAASAQDTPIEEVVADLAYGYCPLFLAGQFPLADNESLTRHGFAGQVQTGRDPRFGAVQLVEAKRADGELAFGGVPGKACNVTVIGPNRAKALARLRASMALMGLDFKPAANATPVPAGLTVETFRAAVGGQILNLQLIEGAAPTALVSAQLYVTNQ